MAPAAEMVLVGSGHSHLEVIKAYKKLDPKPYRLTLINRFSDGIYKGCLARYIAQELTEKEATIDVGHLCFASDVRFFLQEVTGVDFDNKQIFTSSEQHQVFFDAISFDVGADPDRARYQELGVDQGIIIPFKPTRNFVKRIEKLEILANEQHKKLNIVVLGHDLRSIEIANALAVRFRKLGMLNNEIDLYFIFSSDLLKHHVKSEVLVKIKSNFIDLGVKYYEKLKIAKYNQENKTLVLSNKEEVPCDFLLPIGCDNGNKLFLETALSLDQRGLVRVNPNLESTSHSGVYAVGSSAAWLYPFLSSQSLTYDQKMSESLAKNLSRRFTGLPQIECKLPKKNVEMIYMNSKNGLFKKGLILSVSSWAKRNRRLKDSRWYKKYRADINSLRMSTYIESGNLSVDPCNGSGDALVNGTMDLFSQLRKDQLIDKGIHTNYLHTLSEEKNIRMLQYMCEMRSFTQDFFAFSKIASTHASNFILSQGLIPQHGHIIGTIPFGPKNMMGRDFVEMITGVKEAFLDYPFRLGGYYAHAGNHGSLAIILQSITMEHSSNTDLLCNKKFQLGDHIIITKPLGSGFLFSGYERLKVRSNIYWSILRSMEFSHKNMKAIFSTYPISCADSISAFGLARHLDHFIETDNYYIDLDLSCLPIYRDLLPVVDAGIRSSMHTQNRIPFIKSIQCLRNPARSVAEFLFDPQTAGPIILGVSPKYSSKVLDAIYECDLKDAAIIGEVKKKADMSAPNIILKN